MNNLINKVLTKKMDRKEFLVFLGVISISFIGIPRMIDSLTHALKINKPVTTGFGSGIYGGIKEEKS